MGNDMTTLETTASRCTTTALAMTTSRPFADLRWWSADDPLALASLTGIPASSIIGMIRLNDALPG